MCPLPLGQNLKKKAWWVHKEFVLHFCGVSLKPLTADCRASRIGFLSLTEAYSFVLTRVLFSVLGGPRFWAMERADGAIEEC